MPATCCGTCRPKITFRLEKWEKALVFQVLDMDERFRSQLGGPILRFTAPNGIDVQSCSGPDLHGETISLRGDCPAYDFRIGGRSFTSNDLRDAAHARILDALRDWAENWEGFKGPCCPNATPTEGNVFTF